MRNGELLSGCCLNLKLEEPFFSQTREELLTPPLCYFHGQGALADHTVAQQNDCSRNCSAIVNSCYTNSLKNQFLFLSTAPITTTSFKTDPSCTSHTTPEGKGH